MPGRDLFIDDPDRRIYLSRVAEVSTARGWQLLAYCLMGNHVHLLVRTPIGDLGDGVKEIHELHAMRLNRRQATTGHVFRDRFHNRLVRTDAHAQGALRYIARNPVAAHMCTSAAAWPWSSHRVLSGYQPAPAWLDVPAALAFFGEDARSARLAYLGAVGTSDEELVHELCRPHSDHWLVDAVDAYGLEIGAIAEALDISTSTVYRRLAAARAANEGTVPTVAR